MAITSYKLYDFRLRFYQSSIKIKTKLYHVEITDLAKKFYV